MPSTSQKRLILGSVVPLGNCKRILENTCVKETTQKSHLGAAVGLRVGTGPAPGGMVIGTSLRHHWDIVLPLHCLAQAAASLRPWARLLPAHPQSFALWRNPKTFTQRDEAERNPKHPKTRDKEVKTLGTGCLYTSQPAQCGPILGCSSILGKFAASASSTETFPHPRTDSGITARMGISHLEQPRWLGRGSSLMCYQEHHRKSNSRPPLSRQRLLGAEEEDPAPFEYLNPRGFRGVLLIPSSSDV